MAGIISDCTSEEHADSLSPDCSSTLSWDRQMLWLQRVRPGRLDTVFAVS